MVSDKAGVLEGDARSYEGHVREGSMLPTVHATGDGRAREAHAVFGRAAGTAGPRGTRPR